MLLLNTPYQLHTYMAHAVAFSTIRTAKTREHLRKVLTQRSCKYQVTGNVTAQHKNCPSSAFDDRQGRDLFRVLKRQPISQPPHLVFDEVVPTEAGNDWSRETFQCGCNLRRSPVVLTLAFPYQLIMLKLWQISQELLGNAKINLNCTIHSFPYQFFLWGGSRA